MFLRFQREGSEDLTKPSTVVCLDSGQIRIRLKGDLMKQRCLPLSQPAD